MIAIVVAGVVLARGTSNGSRALPVAGGSNNTSSTPAPPLAGTDPITGRHVSLAAYSGKPVIVNIWASWCTGCNQEARDLERFARAHPEAQLIGIDTEDTRGDARAFYARYGWHHPSVFDPHGTLAAAWGLQGLPTTYFLNSRGRIVARIVGAGRYGDFEAGLRRATHNV